MYPALRSSSANATTPGVSPCAWWKSTTSAIFALRVNTQGSRMTAVESKGAGARHRPRIEQARPGRAELRCVLGRASRQQGIGHGTGTKQWLGAEEHSAVIIGEGCSAPRL